MSQESRSPCGYFSHRIVEEFMILANEVVARHLEEPRHPVALSRSRRTGSGESGGSSRKSCRLSA